MKNKIDRLKVLHTISTNWPISVTGVAEKLGFLNGDEYSDRLAINAFKYHFDLLHRDGKVKVKKIGRNLVAWPAEIEKLRIVQELMKEI